MTTLALPSAYVCDSDLKLPLILAIIRCGEILNLFPLLFVADSPDWVAADDPVRFDDVYLFATHGASSKPAKVAIIAIEMTDNWAT